MQEAGRLEITVAGERWRPVTTLERCGPDDLCYVVRVAEDGSATVAFGDGATGRRPPSGARIEAAYRAGGGDTGNVGHRRSRSPLAALLELLAEMADLLARNQDQIASEAFIETADGRTNLDDVTDLRTAVAGRHESIGLCLSLRPRARRRRSRPASA